MNVNFLAIRMKNFLQIGNQFEVFQLNKNQFTAIVGKNGSGKSTLVDAITYVLFKKPFRKIKLNQLINNTNKKNMLVEIYFEIGKDKYLVKRGEKPKVFEIYKNNKLVDVDPSVKDYQEYLETEIIKQSYKTFCQINVISRAKYIQFMDLDASSRRAIVEDLLDSNIFTVMQNLAKDVIKNIKHDITDVETNITILTSKIDNINNVLSSFNKQKQSQIDSYQQQIDQQQQQLQQLKQQLQKVSACYQQLQDNSEKVIPHNIIEKVTSKFKELDNQIYHLRDSIAKLNNDKASINSLTQCPKCLQLVDQTHKQHIIDDIQQKLADKQQQYNKANDLHNKIGEKLKTYQQIQNNINNCNEKQKQIQSNIVVKNDNIVNFNNQIKIIKDKTMPNLENVDQLSSDLAVLKEKNDSLSKKLNNYNAALKLLGDDGIKAAVIQKYIPIINQTINQYLNAMQMYVEFTLDSEFNEEIKAINRDLFTYNSFSEGQKMRIDLAIMLTWRQIARLRNTTSTNLFILDEIADGSLDDEGMSEFLNILKTIADVQNTFIISHKDSTIENFDNIIMVETEGNFSKYTYI